MSTGDRVASRESKLSCEEWTHLSNLIHGCDLERVHALTEGFWRSQLASPVKIRFKMSSVQQLWSQIIKAVRLLVEKNVDFLWLDQTTRLITLQRSVAPTVGLGSTFIIFNSNLIRDPLFRETSSLIYGSHALKHMGDAVSHLYRDIVFVKLVIHILMFSTSDCTHHGYNVPLDRLNMRTVWKIQARYIELAWKYVCYRYNLRIAIRCFSDLIRCLFSLDRSLFSLMRTG